MREHYKTILCPYCDNVNVLPSDITQMAIYSSSRFTCHHCKKEMIIMVKPITIFEAIEVKE